jgi:D-alanyl-lipoteichoic acid acyltransferase DltB (MBOAT superfamily)
MLFNSIEFLIFFPVVTLLYFLLPHRWRWLHLLISSCIFYMAFIPAYILILFATILIDYYAGIMIGNASGKNRKRWLVLSIIANVGVLAVFKYYNFFIDNVNDLLHALGITTQNLPYLGIILPIGLSFHTFQAMSYTIEVYRGHQPPERHFGIYALYVMFYPQLVAGPIERPQNLLPQFHEKKYFNSAFLLQGLRLMLWGLFKKVVIADRLAMYVNAVYLEPEKFHALNLIIATVFFAIQIYCDFSGYSDMAIGAAKTMGYDLMVNFKRPYFAKNIQAFWARWHVSLSTWFRDYLYVALGGNRRGLRRTYINVAIVFLVSGFWHGANWTFIVWGALHTLFIITYMLYNRHAPWKLPNNAVVNFLSLGFTFVCVSFAWIFFRAENMQDAWLMAERILRYDQSEKFHLWVGGYGKPVFGAVSALLALGTTALMLLTELKLPPRLELLDKKPYADLLFCTTLLIIVIVLGNFQKTSFIYFQF